MLCLFIRITCPCNEDPFTPHFYIVKLGFTGVLFFLIFALNHRLWVLVRTASLTIYVLGKNKKYTTIFHLKIIIFTAVKYCSILHTCRHVCVMFNIYSSINLCKQTATTVLQSLTLVYCFPIYAQNVTLD